MPLHLTEAQLNEPVAAHVRRDFTTLYPEWTVTDALEHMRKFPPPGRIIYFYVVDEQMHLHGVVPTRRLLLSPPDTRVADVMIRNVISIPADATVLEACEFFTLHRLLAFPVVEAERRLVGVIDVELYAEELADTGDTAPPRERDEVFQLIGVRLTRAQQARPMRAFRGRLPWLLCNIGGGALAALAVPYLLRLLRRDPQLAAGPIALACADVLTLLAYFNLARLLA